MSCSEDKAPNNRSSFPSFDIDSKQPISYRNDIQPIFNYKCIACHACYDAPCQLVLTSAEGLVRGAHTKGIYSSLRAETDSPTRLNIDASSENEWRQLGFHSVIPTDKNKSSLLLNMLNLGFQHPVVDNAKLPEELEIGIKRKNECPTTDEFTDYTTDNPLGGMPYAVNGLNREELETIAIWQAQGALIDDEAYKTSKEEEQQVAIWETFLNQTNNREKLVARYLFEHLFIAHLYFSNVEKPGFFRLVRSHSAPGEPVRPISSARPNSEPKNNFWYRLMPIEDTIVYKTHITYALNPDRLQRYEELFFKDKWEVDTLPGYTIEERSNPFQTFAAIPPRARYQFLLDDAKYFIRTFIRGPVCHGQIATDVIRDRFWAMFESPDVDEYINNKAYREATTELLSVPGVEDGLENFVPEWLKYRQRNIDYLKLREKQYIQQYPEGPNLGHIWNGDNTKTDAFQTIFRHHNSAAIETGLIGGAPKTIWVMDYALLERSYYVLVANFNVFGNVTHQSLTRLYFDLIRNGAEQNFLRFMPQDVRQTLLKSWYQNMAEIKLFLTYDAVDEKIPTAIQFFTTDPMEEFSEKLNKTFSKVIAKPILLNNHESTWKELLTLNDMPLQSLPVVEYFPEHSLLSVTSEKNDTQIYSIIRNRIHSNVAFMLGEKLRYQPELDTLTIYPGVQGSYPNFMFSVSENEIKEFVKALRTTNEQEKFDEIIEEWGVRRSHPQFWELFHSTHDYLQKTDPIEAGILDINRFQNL